MKRVNFKLIMILVILQVSFTGCKINGTVNGEKNRINMGKTIASRPNEIKTGFSTEDNLTQKDESAGGSKMGASSLEIFSKGYPRAFFFRPSEARARAGIPYEQWEKEYAQLNGIMGKALDEEIPNTSKNNIEYFTRYKKANPEKAVFLHYNGKVRRPEDGEGFFAGHWLYHEGTYLTADIGDGIEEIVIPVASPSALEDGTGQYKDKSDLAIVKIGFNGMLDWEAAEQVKLVATDRKQKTITVKRGQYNTKSYSFPKGSYIASHVKNVYGWAYNFSTEAPRDAAGRNAIDTLVDDLYNKLGPDGALSNFDGIEFDVHLFQFGGGKIDFNGDGKADPQGIINGINTYGLGVFEFNEKLRKKLPDKIIMADGHKSDIDQRSFGILNGIESEGWPDTFDVDLIDWSAGLNRHHFWHQNGAVPSLSYVVYKYRPTGGSETIRIPLHYPTFRIVLAAAQFTDSAFTIESIPGHPKGMLDELVMGQEKQTNWLGMPVASPVHLAMQSPELLAGRGENWDDDFVNTFSGKDVSFNRISDIKDTSANQGCYLKVSTESPSASGLNFTIPNLEVSGQDLFITLTLWGEPINAYPPAIARQLYVTASPYAGTGKAATSFTWFNGNPFEATFYFRDIGPGKVDLSFQAEGSEELYFIQLKAYSAPDAMYREFENGIVFANPSNRPYTFELNRLLAGISLQHLTASLDQDFKTNDGTIVGQSLTIGPKDALFVKKLKIKE